MKYQSLKRIKKKNAIYNIIMAGRSSGKSTAITKELIDDYKATGHKFIRLFRRINYFEAAPSWFDEYNEGGKFYEGDKFEFKEGCYYINGKIFGYTAIISLASRLKSTVFDREIYTAVFDEYQEISPETYVDGEVHKFFSILSTVFRQRDRRVWLLGNNDNETNKYNPYHRYFNIDIDRDNIKQGDIRVYKSDKWKDAATIAFEYGRMAYEAETEIPKAERVEGNNVGTTGDFSRPYDVFIQDEWYSKTPSFLRDSVDNFYISDTYDRCYFPVVNDELQSIDWISTADDLNSVGKSGNKEKYDILLTYADYYIETLGEEEYNNELDANMPYDITIPLYAHGNRYGENCEGFLTGIYKSFRGYSYRFCDGNIKYIFDRIVKQGKLED